MANSGSFNTSGYSGRYLTFSWSVKSQNTSTNQTTINWSLTGAGTASASWYMAGNFKVVIDGATVYSSSTRIKLYNGTTVASGTYTMTHNNSTGKRSFSASAEAGIYTIAVNCSGSGSWDLPTIPRYATSNQSLSSKTETSITMNWSSDSTIDYIWYSSNNGSSWTGHNVTDGTKGSYTISGLAANTQYNIKTRVRRKDSQLTTDSSSLSVTTYNYPYATSMPNFTIGNKLTLGFYNPLGRSFTFYIIANGIQISNSWNISGTSYTGVDASSSQSQLYATIPNAKSATYKVKVVYGSSTITKTGGTYSINTSACTPSITSVAYQDTNSTTTVLTGNNQQIIRNQSTVKYTATGLTVKNLATIKSCSVFVNNKSYNLTVSGTSATGGNAKIDSGSNVTATFTLTDSRGLTATKSITVQMLDWVLPTAIITLQRHNNFYSETDITVDAMYSSLNNKNTISIQFRYKKVSDTSYSAYQNLQDNVTDEFTADNNYDWNVQVKITDKFGTTTYNLTLSKGLPIIYFDRIKSSTGFNCFPEDNQSVEVLGKNIYNALFFNKNDTITLDGLTVCGMLSGGAEDVNFSVVLPKSMANVTPSINELKTNIRVSAGGYLFGSFVSGGYNVLGDSTLTVSINKINDYMVRIIITKSSAFSTTNNTPLAVTLDNVVLSFT